MTEQRDILEYDVCILGAGPAGLSAAFKLKQLDQSGELSICVLEKSAEIGGHSLSGAVMEAKALSELIPTWRQEQGFKTTKVTKHLFKHLSETASTTLPTPPQIKAGEQYIIHQSELVKYLAKKCEDLGIEIFPGFSAQKPLIDNNKVIGIRTGDFGLDAQGNKTDRYTPGPDIHSKVTLVADGCRGHITKQLVEHFKLENDSAQSYALGLKEVWKLKNTQKIGQAIHTVGWPLNNDTYGGGWAYTMEDKLLSLGFVIGLDYKDPDIQPHRMLQRFKTHPTLSKMLEGAELVSSGARTLYEGGLNGQYKLSMNGALLLGDAAGTLNIAKVKGIHTAIKSGMLAAEATYLNIKNQTELSSYEKSFEESWAYKELHKVRNIRAWFKKGFKLGMFGAALETITLGKLPYSLKIKTDHKSLHKHASFKPAKFEPNANSLSRLDALAKSAIHHNEEQPSHIQIIDPDICMSRCADEYNHPCLNFCPAQVFELVDAPDTEQGMRLKVNAANCLHCKTCDIKDPYQVINWVAPEGGSGPNYDKS